MFQKPALDLKQCGLAEIEDQLCIDLKSIWANNFTLIGIEFDADLANIDTHFRKKFEDIKYIYNSWLYTSLLLGKITVIKVLALSKLSFEDAESPSNQVLLVLLEGVGGG